VESADGFLSASSYSRVLAYSFLNTTFHIEINKNKCATFFSFKDNFGKKRKAFPFQKIACVNLALFE